MTISEMPRRNRLKTRRLHYSKDTKPTECLLAARAAARMTAMTNSKNYEQGKELGGYQAALQAINTASGRNGAFSGDAYGNNGIEGPNVQGLLCQVQGAVGSGPNIPTGFRENVAGMAGTNPASEAGQLPTNSPLFKMNMQPVRQLFITKHSKQSEMYLLLN